MNTLNAVRMLYNSQQNNKILRYRRSEDDYEDFKKYGRIPFCNIITGQLGLTVGGMMCNKLNH